MNWDNHEHTRTTSDEEIQEQNETKEDILTEEYSAYLDQLEIERNFILDEDEESNRRINYHDE